MDEEHCLNEESKKNAIAFLKGIPLSIRSASEVFARTSEERLQSNESMAPGSSSPHFLHQVHNAKHLQSSFKRSISTFQQPTTGNTQFGRRSSLALDDSVIHSQDMPLIHSSVWRKDKLKLKKSVVKMKYITNAMLVDSRLLFVEPRHSTPFFMVSVLPYGKGNKATRTAATHSKDLTRKAHFAEIATLPEDVDAFGASSSPDNVVSYQFLLRPSITSVAVPVDLNSSEWTSGKHRTLLALKGYIVSVIDYAKPSELKRNLNLKFRQTFPQGKKLRWKLLSVSRNRTKKEQGEDFRPTFLHVSSHRNCNTVNITLSKIRSLEYQMAYVAKQFDLQTGVLSRAVSYFERLAFSGKSTKLNRHHVAATCLLLSAKVHGDLKLDVLTQLLSSLEHSLKTSRSSILAFEFPVFVALGFSLMS